MLPALRFAPSPNGRLHAGHGYSAWLNACLAAQWDGRFLLRLEDIDTTRCTDALTQHCLEDLAWLGLHWEGPVRKQSEHMTFYTKGLNRLKAQGLIYPCFCTRAARGGGNERDPDGVPLYDGACNRLPMAEVHARLAAGEKAAWRLNIKRALDAAPGPHVYTALMGKDYLPTHQQAQPARWGDVVLARKDIGVSYHLCVVMDDAWQGITHVVRGMDLEAATDVHVLLQALLGLPTPVYHHHALLPDAKGEKLSKSRHSESLAELRAQGQSPEALIQQWSGSI